MFEKIVLRRSENGSAITVGEIAEALLFYQNVHIVIDYGSLINLIQTIGMPTLLLLISRPNITAVYCEETLGTKTDKISTIEVHDFVAFKYSGDQTANEFPGRKQRFEFILKKHGYNKRQARNLTSSFLTKVPVKKLTSDYFLKGGIVKSARVEIHDSEFINHAIKNALCSILELDYLSKDFEFRISPIGNGFQIIHNLDFSTINTKRKQLDPAAAIVTPASLLNKVLEAKADVALASHYGGDFYTSEISSEIIKIKHRDILKRTGIDQSELSDFKNIVLDQVPAIREVVNNGERSFTEFLKLLDKSQKFRSWASNVNPDEKLVKQYFEAITSEGWVSKLPSKILRYALGSAVTLAYPVTGTLGSLADNVVSEKIFKGWRPNHFVEKRLKPFLETN